jgi:hypothetical protein
MASTKFFKIAFDFQCTLHAILLEYFIESIGVVKEWCHLSVKCNEKKWGTFKWHVKFNGV